jgi:hypothetical protein
MEEKQKEGEAKFEVNIKGLSLSEDLQLRINEEIQQTVLREIARIDNKGDRAFRIKFPKCGITRTCGIIIEPEVWPT